ncbi:MAG: phospholipase A [Moraxella sp.]|nr:phospholipase A [Moraxella sp.]
MRIHSLLWAMTAVLFAQTATAEALTAEQVTETSQALDLTSPSHAETASTVSFVMPETQQALFFRCAQIVSDAGRLACFDSLAVDNTPSTLAQKRPVDLSSTIRRTITGSPQLVMVNDTDVSALAPDIKEDGESLTAFQDQLESTTNDAKVLTELGLSADALARYTPLSLAFDLDKNSERGLWSARPHNANYILPLYFNTQPNRNPTSPSLGTQTFSPDELRAAELKFQMSLKTKAAENLFGTDADLWLGYTQVSHWQVYNENNSRPFRAHDYEPEIFLTQPVVADLPFNGKLRMLGVGAVHHSNGESDPVSRSWNRLYAMGGAEWGKLTVMPRVWVRAAVKDGQRPDDNPDITDYYGYGDVKFLYQLDQGNNVSGLFRYNPRTNKGAVQLDYVRPLHRGVSGYVQLFHGYGQSIIDYNHEATSVGVGIMLNDWMGL